MLDRRCRTGTGRVERSGGRRFADAKRPSMPPCRACASPHEAPRRPCRRRGSRSPREPASPPSGRRFSPMRFATGASALVDFAFEQTWCLPQVTPRPFWAQGRLATTAATRARQAKRTREGCGQLGGDLVLSCRARGGKESAEPISTAAWAICCSSDRHRAFHSVLRRFFTIFVENAHQRTDR